MIYLVFASMSHDEGPYGSDLQNCFRKLSDAKTAARECLKDGENDWASVMEINPEQLTYRDIWHVWWRTTLEEDGRAVRIIHEDDGPFEDYGVFDDE